MPETYSYTGDQLAAQVEQKFGDSGGVQITRAMQLAWINNGIRAIAQQSPFIEKTLTTGLLAGVNTYALATLFPNSRIADIVQVAVNGKSVDLIPFGEFQALIVNDQTFSGGVATGVPAGRPTIATLFADTLTLWPNPGQTIASGIVLYTHVYPNDLVAITDKLTVPDRFYNALFDYVFAQALELNTNFDASQIKLAHFQTGVQREYEREHKSPTDFYSGMIMDPYDDDNPYFAGSY